MGTVRVDNECKMHAIDLICTVCKTNRDQAGKTLRRLLARKKFKESDITVHTYNHFQQKQKISMVSYADAIRLIMMLPGENSIKVVWSMLGYCMNILQATISSKEV